MRLSPTRVGVCEFDFSKLYPRRDVEGTKDEQDMCYIAERFVAAAQREKERGGIEPSSHDNQRYDLLWSPSPPYRPMLNDGAPLRLSHRVPAFLPENRETLLDRLKRTRDSLGHVIIKPMSTERFVDPFGTR